MADLDTKTVLEFAVFIIGLIGHAWFLGSRIQRIEDTAEASKALLTAHVAEDREEFRRVYDKLDRKSDKPAALAAI